jgi:hypothetical protein
MRKKLTYAHKEKIRSSFEGKILDQLRDADIKFEYETHKIKYEVPSKGHVYKPDIILNRKNTIKLMYPINCDNKELAKIAYPFVLSPYIYIEVKGLFDSEDRKKHLHVRESNPNLDIRFVFQNAWAKIRKGSKTSYADWCDKNGFKWAHKYIPQEWLDE